MRGNSTSTTKMRDSLVDISKPNWLKSTDFKTNDFTTHALIICDSGVKRFVTIPCIDHTNESV